MHRELTASVTPPPKKRKDTEKDCNSDIEKVVKDMEHLNVQCKTDVMKEEAVGTEEAEAAEEVAGGEAERKEGEAVTEESRWRGTRRCLNRSSGG